MDEKRAKIEELQKLKWLNKFNFFNLAFEIKDNIPINSLLGGLLGLVLGIGEAYIVTTFLKLPFFYSSYLFLLGFSVAIIVAAIPVLIINACKRRFNFFIFRNHFIYTDFFYFGSVGKVHDYPNFDSFFHRNKFNNSTWCRFM
jgi:hypothetical protein